MTEILGAARIPFMLAGSFASTAHGAPRSTQDIDIVVDPPGLAAIHALLDLLPTGLYYADRDTAEAAFRGRAMFNVIDWASGWKVDFIVRKDRDFSREEFARRLPLELFGVDLFVASAEDTIVAKLEWSRSSGGSERQRRDVAGIVAASREVLDFAYIESWVHRLGLDEEWVAAQATALA